MRARVTTPQGAVIAKFCLVDLPIPNGENVGSCLNQWNRVAK